MHGKLRDRIAPAQVPVVANSARLPQHEPGTVPRFRLTFFRFRAWGLDSAALVLFSEDHRHHYGWWSQDFPPASPRILRFGEISALDMHGWFVCSRLLETARREG